MTCSGIIGMKYQHKDGKFVASFTTHTRSKTGVDEVVAMKVANTYEGLVKLFGSSFQKTLANIGNKSLILNHGESGQVEFYVESTEDVAEEFVYHSLYAKSRLRTLLVKTTKKAKHLASCELCNKKANLYDDYLVDDDHSSAKVCQIGRAHV